MCGLRAGQGAVARVDAGHADDVAVGVVRQRDAGVEHDVVVDVLDVEIDRAALEVAAERDAQLAALVGGEAGIADTVVLAPEAAHAEAPVAERRAVPAVDAAQAVVAGLQLEPALGHLAAAAGDEIDHAARRVRREHRGRAAAHHLDALDRLVEAKALVGVEPAQARIVLQRQPVLLHADRREALLRNAARADVGAAFAARGLDPETRHRLQRVGDAARRVHLQLLLVDRGDRIAGLGAAARACAGAAGDDDAVQLHRIGRRRGRACRVVRGICGCGLLRGRGCGQRGADQGETAAAHDAADGFSRRAEVSPLTPPPASRVAPSPATQERGIGQPSAAGFRSRR